MQKKVKTPCNGIVYRITCLANGKSYIGSSKCGKKRWNEHRCDLRKGRHANKYLQRAWNKYGEEAFEFHVLEPVCWLEELHEAEQKWIDLYQAAIKKHGFNRNPIAEKPPNTKGLGGWKHSEEAKQKISAALTGKRRSDEVRSAMSASRKGKKRNPEAVAKTAAALRGKKQSPELIKKRTSGMKGRKHSEEARLKMSIARKGKMPKFTIVKRWLVTDPDGNSFEIVNLTAFCRERGLDTGNMIATADGRQKTSKGWKCKRLETLESTNLT